MMGPVDGTEEGRQAALTEVVVWVHEQYPEICPCKQCGYQRELIARIEGYGLDLCPKPLWDVTPKGCRE
jgi:hypothetical protein